jgi:hypothetical protein
MGWQREELSVEPFEVVCDVHGFAWECRVFVGTPDEGVEHLVKVSRAELDRYAPGHYEPTALVEASFRFLLEREPASAIMRSFNLSVIESYFPEYSSRIGEYLDAQ